jgi:CTP:phosphocholine cytidylyltransferase-like protein
MRSKCQDNQKANKITTALLMAAGMGTRIRPISEEIPKPLIPVHGTPIIETLIGAILLAGIPKIIITVGYQKDKYLYLKEKYNNITLVENKDYSSRNTISSFYAAMNYLRNKNCLICESDLCIFDSSIIKGEMDKSRYLMRNVSLQNYEWGFDLQNDRVRRVVRPKPDVLLDHHMYGIAYWMKEDLEKLIDAVNVSYHKVGYEQLAYDEVANEIFYKIDMGVIRVKDGQLYEIDCLQDLVKVDPAYNIYLHHDVMGG